MVGLKPCLHEVIRLMMRPSITIQRLFGFFHKSKPILAQFAQLAKLPQLDKMALLA